MNKSVFLATGALVGTVTASAFAVEPWVDRPLTLQGLTFRGEAGLGLAQAPSLTGMKGGVGAQLDAALGVTNGLELGVRTGYRFSDPAIWSGAAFGAGADANGRLYETETFGQGGDNWTNPELRITSSFLATRIVSVGLQARYVFPFVAKSDFAGLLGIPIRVQLPKMLRVDTGVYFPYVNTSPQSSWAMSIPAQVYVQVGDAFAGVLTGIRYNRFGDTNRSDITFGFGGGYTLSSMVDLKAQVYAWRINDADWSRTIGGGLAVAVTVP
ncbi:MAG: hypothetical protein WCI05_03255 [Myxococcales bacterium]